MQSHQRSYSYCCLPISTYYWGLAATAKPLQASLAKSESEAIKHCFYFLLTFYLPFSGKMGSTQDLQMLLAKRDARIRELEIENMELKSKLDKYQSIFPSSPTPVGVPGSIPAVGGPDTPQRGVASRKTNRALGISAEPQSLATLQELTTKTFPEYKKEEK